VMVKLKEWKSAGIWMVREWVCRVGREGGV